MGEKTIAQTASSHNSLAWWVYEGKKGRTSAGKYWDRETSMQKNMWNAVLLLCNYWLFGAIVWNFFCSLSKLYNFASIEAQTVKIIDVAQKFLNESKISAMVGLSQKKTQHLHLHCGKKCWTFFFGKSYRNLHPNGQSIVIQQANGLKSKVSLSIQLIKNT